MYKGRQANRKKSKENVLEQQPVDKVIVTVAFYIHACVYTAMHA